MKIAIFFAVLGLYLYIGHRFFYKPTLFELRSYIRQNKVFLKVAISDLGKLVEKNPENAAALDKVKQAQRVHEELGRISNEELDSIDDPDFLYSLKARLDAGLRYASQARQMLPAVDEGDDSDSNDDKESK